MALQDDVVSEGDIGFRGFASRPDPVTLGPGLCRLAENKRFVRGRAETRKGIKRMATGINAGITPLVVPFFLGNDFAVDSITRVSATATVTTAAAHGLANGEQVNIRGADEAEYNGDFAVTVTSATEFTVTVSGSPASPATGTILMNDGPVLRTVYSGGLFSACLYASPVFDPGEEYIAMAGTDALWLWKDGTTAVSKSYPEGETVEDGDQVQVFQAYDKLYILRAQELNGLYGRQSVTSITRSGTTATVTKVGHGFSSNMRVRIEGADQVGYNHEFEITVLDADTFTFTVAHSPVTPATGTITARRVKAPLVWDGVASTVTKVVGGSNAAGDTFRTMASTNVAQYFNNQVILAPTPIKDEVLISDVLDGDTYDPMLKSFRANAGGSDYIVAIHPYAESQVLVLCRNSIYRAKIALSLDGTEISTTDSYMELLTNEIGCVARDSVVTAGQWIYFLSDSGVYRLDSNFADLKLRGQSVPLSDSISDRFDLLNWATAGLSNGVWFDNRYWLAVPVGDATSPNAVLVYNALNEAWESVDVYPVGLARLVISKYSGRRRLFGVSREGTLYLLDEKNLGDEAADSTQADLPIDGKMITRRYVFGAATPKRFMRAVVSAELQTDTEMTVKANIFEPDLVVSAGGQSNVSGTVEDYVLKVPIRQTGTFVELEIEDILGRGLVRTVTVAAAGNDLHQLSRNQN
jgi:hypothetical protein